MLTFLKEYNDLQFHLIGIGGISMSAIAKLLLYNNITVSGSDIRESELTNSLIEAGASIKFYHSEYNIKDASVVIYSASIKENNPEFKKAKEKGITLISRAKFLSLILAPYYSIAITGTHGKTTTSSIISKIMYDAQFDPLIILGATSPHLNNSNVYYGKSKWAVFEACEAYGSLYSYNPTFAVITNIELEHLDYFKSIKHIKKEFHDFILKIPFYGRIFVNGDDPNIKDITKEYTSKQITTFGFNKNNDIIAYEVNYNSSNTSFKIKTKNTSYKLISPLFAKHNVYNMLAAISVALSLKINFEQIQKALYDFKNADRRLELVNTSEKLRIYSDYAHHPSEIKATISAIKQKEKEKTIISIFQPHLYSRTKQFYKEFADSLKDSDLVLLMPIYPARELPIKNINSKIIKNHLNNFHNYNKVKIFEDTEELLNFILTYLASSKKKYILLFLGAGDIHAIIKELIDKYNNLLLK